MIRDTRKTWMLFLLAGFLFLLNSIPALAITREEIIRMSNADISDDLIITMIRRSNTIFDLEPDDIIELKKEGVSEKVIKEMLTTSGETAPGYDPYDKPIPSVSKSGKTTGEQNKQFGIVTIKNRDNRDYGIWVDRMTRTIIFGFRNSQAPIILKKSSSVGIRLETGTIKFKWDGRDNYGDMKLNKGEEKQVAVSMKPMKNRFAFTMSVSESEHETMQTGLQTFYHQWFGPDPQPKHVAVTTHTAHFYKKRFHHPARIYRILRLISITQNSSIRRDLFKNFFRTSRTGIKRESNHSR